jgi:hypothetical protein
MRRESRGDGGFEVPRELPLGPIAPSLSTPAPRKLGPLKNFKSFMLDQSEELLPEDYQRKYDEYCVQYVHDFSDECFHTAKTEEWFQNRYNPLNLEAIANEVSAWAATESATIHKELTAGGASAVSLMRLDLGSNSRLQALQPSVPSPMASAPENDDSVDKVDATVSNASDEKTSGDVTDGAGDVGDFAGRQIRGHEDRTIKFSGVPISCSKTMFTNHINKLLGKTLQPNELPERVLVSHPFWNLRDRNIFEKLVQHFVCVLYR